MARPQQKHALNNDMEWLTYTDQLEDINASNSIDAPFELICTVILIEFYIEEDVLVRTDIVSVHPIDAWG